MKKSVKIRNEVRVKNKKGDNSNEIAHEFGVFSIDNGPNPFYSYKIRAPGFVYLQQLDLVLKNHN